MSTNTNWREKLISESANQSATSTRAGKQFLDQKVAVAWDRMMTYAEAELETGTTVDYGTLKAALTSILQHEGIDLNQDLVQAVLTAHNA
jgi:dihydroneopterin aldolase